MSTIRNAAILAIAYLHSWARADRSKDILPLAAAARAGVNRMRSQVEQFSLPVFSGGSITLRANVMSDRKIQPGYANLAPIPPTFAAAKNTFSGFSYREKKSSTSDVRQVELRWLRTIM
jgi:hypothetical protein